MSDVIDAMLCSCSAHSGNSCPLKWDEDDGGACWDVHDCSCCSLSCIACWCFCCPCSLTRCYAYSLNQRCAIMNHCVPTMACPLCVAIIIRHNIRKKNKIGDTSNCWGWCCDSCLKICFLPCVFLTLLKPFINSNSSHQVHKLSRIACCQRR